MKILCLTSEYPPQVGGIASHVFELVKALRVLGHTVAVCVPDRPGAAEYDRSHPQDAPRRIPVLIRAKPVYDWLLRRLITRALCETRFDVIHVHGLRSLAGSLGHGVPVVFTNHTSGFLARLDGPPRRRSRVSTLLARIDGLVAPSRELIDAAVSLGYSGPTRYIPNGVDIDRFKPDPAGRSAGRRELGLADGEVAILVARRMAAKNGVRYMAAAVPYLRDRSCRVIFAGDGEERESIEATLRAAEVIDRCTLLGSVANDAMPDLYRAADICVLPSLMEATSIAGLEAMATAIPVVGSRVGGIPEIVTDQATGLLVPPADPQAIASAVRLLIDDEALRTRLGARARAQVEQRHAWRRIAESTADALAEAMQRHGTRLANPDA